VSSSHLVWAAVTNEKGYYFVNNVPVGTYTLRAQSWLRAVGSAQVRVLGGQTITEDIKMQSSAVVLTGITVTAARSARAARSGDVEGHHRR